MDAMLRRIVEENDLTAIGVNYWPNIQGLPFTVYVHWADGPCNSGNGETIEEAAEVALAEMREARAEQTVKAEAQS